MTRFSSHPPGGRAGFSLVEVVIALALFVIGMYGVLDLLDQSRRLEDVSQKHLQAVALAEGKLAELRAAGYDAFVADAASKTPKLPIAAPSEVKAETMGGLAWQVQAAAAGMPEACLVSVTVSWNADGEKGIKAPLDKRVTLTELIARPSLAQGGRHANAN